MAKRKGSGVKLLVLLGVLAGGAYGAHRAGWTQPLLPDEKVGPIEGAPVRRGDLRISEVARGNLEAKDSVVLRSELEGRSTIIFLAEEGTRVEVGDLVAELDVAATDDERVRQEIAVQQADLDVVKAEKQVEIQKIQNESDLAAALLEIELAELDLQKYTDELTGEWVNELAKADETVMLKEEEVQRATDEFEWTQKLEEEGFIQKNQLEADRLALQRSRIELEQAVRDRKLKDTYGNRRKLAELESQVANSKRDLEKTKKQAEARMADYEAALSSAEYKLAREREKLTKILDQIKKAKLFAPEPGLVVYAREPNRFGSSDVVDEGMEVRERQQIITIPRPGGMVVQASIHETKLKKVRTGMPCLVTVEAFPHRVFNGRLDFVAVMADSGSWRSNPNQRLYKAEIGLFDGIPEMRPGMSASVEILVEDLKDVLYVPRQCVLLDGGQTIAFVKEGDGAARREVTVGLDNAKWVSIVSGLSESDVVLLSPPANFTPAPTPEADAETSAAAAAAAAAAPPARRSIPYGADNGASGPGGFDASRLGEGATGDPNRARGDGSELGEAPSEGSRRGAGFPRGERGARPDGGGLGDGSQRGRRNRPGGDGAPGSSDGASTETPGAASGDATRRGGRDE